MYSALAPRHPAVGLAVPAALLAVLIGVIALETSTLRWPAASTSSIGAPPTVIIQPRSYTYRASGAFLRGKSSIDGPLVAVEAPPPLEIMTYQVSAADYAHCVADGACSKAEPRRPGKGNVPVTGVSFEDANDYAAWLSERTGERWRLPSVAEWAFAAGSKATDEALGIEGGSTDPAERWLAFYEKQSALGVNALATPEPLGAGGFNEYGVADLAGPVWEWTATCDSRTALGPTGEVLTHLDSCGVRILEGRHRTPMSVFVRDGLAGGCATGAPPDNLGFRLVREQGWLDSMIEGLRRLWRRAPA